MRSSLLLLCMFALRCATSAPIDACALLTAADIEQVQGEAPEETKRSDAQCFYRLPTFAKSVSLSATRMSHEEWERMFEKREGEEGEGEEHEARPRPVSGIGDEALWSPLPIGATLYVRDGRRMLRVSIGGNDPDAVRQQKAVELARRALARLR